MNVETTELDVGDRVIDREQAPDRRSPAVVVQLPDEPASEYYIDAVDQTVAALNDEYPADSQVASVAFESDLNRSVPEWRRRPAAELVTEPITLYTYPVGRLKPIGDEWEAPSSGAVERQEIYGEHAEAVEEYIDTARELFIQQDTAARDLARTIRLEDGATDYVANADAVLEGMYTWGTAPDPIAGPEMKSVETRGECHYSRDDRYRPNVSGAICCWECSDRPQNRPEKFMESDEAGPACLPADTSPWEHRRQLRERLADFVTVGAALDHEHIDEVRVAQDLGHFREAVAAGDDDAIRREALRIAYRLTLGHIEEYNYHRALALLRDHNAAADLPIIGDGSAVEDETSTTGLGELMREQNDGGEQ